MDYRLWIGGAWQDSQGGKSMAIQNPATEERLAMVVDASLAVVDRAIRSADAFADGRWSKNSPADFGDAPRRLQAVGFGEDLSAEALADHQATKHVMVA